MSKRPILDAPGAPTQSSGFICNQDWWVDLFSPENVGVSACKLMARIFSSARWVWRKGWTIGGSWREDCSAEKDNKGFSSRGDGGENSHESRSEKARRKAEEKRQARLEKEMLEEEERKQREEVARLVEERRKLRDEVLEAEKESLRRSASTGKKERKKGGERRRQEGSKEKDKGSSKSTSDDELEKRASREREGKQTFDKKMESEKRVPAKTVAMDRTKTPYVSSPRSFKAFASSMKVNKPVNGFDHGHVYGNKKDAQSAGHATGKINSNGDDRRNATKVHRPVVSDVQPRVPAPKRSWLHLFTRSSAVSPCSDANTSHLQSENVHVSDQRMSPDKFINSAQLLPVTGCPPMSYHPSSNPVSQLAADYPQPSFKSARQGFILDDADVFEDPCFVPDPVSFYAPVSKSLDSLPLGPGLGFVANNKVLEPRLAKNGLVPTDVSKPSPIESPLSRLRVSRERYSVPGELSKGMCGSKMDDTYNSHEPGTWQMWGSPLAQNGLGLVGGTNWFSPIGQKSSQEHAMNSLMYDPLVSHSAKENDFLLGRQVPQSIPMGNYPNGGMCSPLRQLPYVSDLLVQRSLFQTLPADRDNCSFPLNQMDRLLLNEVGCDTPNGSASSENSESSSANYWSNRGCTSHGLEDVDYSPIASLCIGSPVTTNRDVQLQWPSFK